VKLGKLPRKIHYRTIPFPRFLSDTAPAPDPAKVYWEYKLPQKNLQMFKNDSLGCCTVAAIAHMIMNMTAHTGSIVIPTDDQVVEFYSAVSGYVPGDESTDNGATITDVLARWQSVGLAGHKIAGWVEFDFGNPQHFDWAQYLFGGADCGMQLPNSAMEQFNANEAWDVVTNDGGIDGGHSVPYFGYGSAGRMGLTWAKNQAATKAFEAKYFDEAYAVFGPDWFDNASIAPNGFDKDALYAYWKTLN